MGARFAEIRPTSATLANLAVYSAVARPGDTIAVLPGWAGGHLSHHEIVTLADYPGLTANYDIARLLPLGAAALAHRQSAGAYADACIDVASALAAAPGAEGLDVVTCERGPTSSHHARIQMAPPRPSPAHRGSRGSGESVPWAPPRKGSI